MTNNINSKEKKFTCWNVRTSFFGSIVGGLGRAHWSDVCWTAGPYYADYF